MSFATPMIQKQVHRTDIQAFRALAVLSVVVFHLWPNRLPGGFVGVDVFFVISGFLITQHLLRDIARNTFSVVAFWARRIRRLLPASLTVLFVTAVAIILVAPRYLWPNWISEIGASAAYFENWALANNAVDYLAADNAASPTQHFWSLSVEEQFYFLLPILMWLLVVLFKGKKAASLSRAIVILLSFIVAASFVIGVYLTFAEPVSSYFFTHVRAWQFAAGALLAAVWAYVPQNRNYKLASLISGLGLIAFSALLLDGSMAYPGFWALLPTLGAVLALSSNLEGGPISKLLSWRPIQFIGDVSYSIYLWHWPLIILLPFVVGNLTTVWKLIIIAVSFALAALSQKYIEQPFINRGRREGAKNKSAIALMFAACGGMLIASTAVSAQADVSIRSELTTQQQQVASALPCFGAASNAPNGIACVNPDLDEILLPSLDLASHDSPALLLPADCQVTRASDSIPKPCDLNGKNEDVKIALIGDSHSAQYMAPMIELAKQNKWQVISYSKGGCPFSFAERTHDAVLTNACKKWVEAALIEVKNKDFDLVVTSQLSGSDWASGKIQQSIYAQEGLVRIWKEINSAGIPVLVIKDNPRPIKAILLCIENNKDLNFDACQNTKKSAMLADPQPAAVKLLNSPITQLVDFTDVYCDDLSCDAVIGGVIVNRDQNHLTNTFSRTLAPYLEIEILKLLDAAK
jgi:peptidoglycan/LPS O-acetylase OafA/YrhL